jgi:DNA-binding transcriptional regulator YiaG
MTIAMLMPRSDLIPRDNIFEDIMHICISGTASPEGTTNTKKQILDVWSCIFSKNTNSGMTFGDNPFQSSYSAIMELHRLTGLTWDQLARLFDVSRRSLHFWASGKALNSANEEHLQQILAVIRNIDRGNARENRSVLLSELRDGTVPFDMLSAKDYEGVIEKLGISFPRKNRKVATTTRHVTALNTPPPPHILVGALQDSIHIQKGHLISTTPIRRKGKS